jgi:hypothetical protein
MWVEGIGNARIPFSVKYFLVAILYYLMSKLSSYILGQSILRIRDGRHGQNGHIYGSPFGRVFYIIKRKR